MVLKAPEKPVALRKESVDRNVGCINRAVNIIESLSARRAWIEMALCRGKADLVVVALRKESVDRNDLASQTFDIDKKVALRKESVDRNWLFRPFWNLFLCRSPQGERG